MPVVSCPRLRTTAIQNWVSKNDPCPRSWSPRLPVVLSTECSASATHEQLSDSLGLC